MPGCHLFDHAVKSCSRVGSSCDCKIKKKLAGRLKSNLRVLEWQPASVLDRIEAQCLTVAAAAYPVTSRISR